MKQLFSSCFASVSSAVLASSIATFAFALPSVAQTVAPLNTSVFGDERGNELIINWAGQDIDSDGVISLVELSDFSAELNSSFVTTLSQFSASAGAALTIEPGDINLFPQLFEYNIELGSVSVLDVVDFSLSGARDDVGFNGVERFGLIFNESSYTFNYSLLTEFEGLIDDSELDGTWERQENTIRQEFTAVTTPEPSLILGFITLGGLMLGSKRKTNG